MNDKYDVLEVCIQEIEKGTDIDTVLARYPKYAEELRPILETSVQAIRLASLGPSPEVERRGRAKVLQYAARMREARALPSRRLWSVPLRRVLVSLAVITMLFLGSNRLVHAASGTLPGDNLYPVKRTWEDVRVLLTFDLHSREALEIEHENERLEELYELFAEGRSAKVDFAGTVTRQNGDLWIVSKIPVVISPQTDLRTPSATVGDAVRVRGVSQADGTVLADRVELLPAGMPLPQVEDDDSSEIDGENHENENEAGEDNSGSGSGGEAPERQTNSEKTSRRGVIDSISGNILVVDGQPMNIAGAEIRGTPMLGAAVKVEGYLDASGVFIVTKIEFESGGSDGESGSNEGSGDHSNDNNEDDNSNDDDNSGENDNNGENDNGGEENNDNSNDNSGDDH